MTYRLGGESWRILIKKAGTYMIAKTIVSAVECDVDQMARHDSALRKATGINVLNLPNCCSPMEVGEDGIMA